MHSRFLSCDSYEDIARVNNHAIEIERGFKSNLFSINLHVPVVQNFI